VYEPPESPEIHVRTAQLSADDCAELIIQRLEMR